MQPGEENLYDGIINNISEEEEYEQVQWQTLQKVCLTFESVCAISEECNYE